MRLIKKYDLRNKIYRKQRIGKSYLLCLSSYLLLLIPFSSSSQLLDSLSLDTLTACTSMHQAILDSNGTLKLDLSKQKLKAFPDEIRKLTNLQYLDLSKNKISDVPEWIGELKNLQFLILSKNNINSLPAQFGELTHLKYFSMSRSDLATLPHSIGNLKELLVMNLWGSKVTTFPPELKNLSGNLQVFDLRDIAIDDYTMASLKALLPSTTIYFTPNCPCER